MGFKINIKIYLFIKDAKYFQTLRKNRYFILTIGTMNEFWQWMTGT